MIVEFQLEERLAGFVVAPAAKGEKVQVMTSEWLTSLQGVHLTWRLEELQGALFARIPEFPDPSQVNNLVVVIRPDLSATAYINEMRATAGIRPARPILAGEPVFAKDVIDILSYDIGIEMPPTCGVVVIRSLGWRKALYYDFRPLQEGAPPRDADPSAILAKQTLEMMRGQFADSLTPPALAVAIGALTDLIEAKSADESQYQEFLERNPWFFGGYHTAIERHTNLDDQNIPDFTGVRASDGFRDIIEIKPPSLACFRADDGFTASFNEAWSQAERYLDFARRQRQYLRDKGLQFENPRCFLLIGQGLTDVQRQALRIKEAFNPAITVITYEELLGIGKAFLATVTTASGVPAG